MKKTSSRERRLHPRLEHKLPVKIVANGYDFVTSTHNISCLGAYCNVNKYVPPFTKISVRLDLPLAAKETSNHISIVECKGVIVRTEDDPAGGFNVAVFFNEIKEPDRNKINQYISQFLPKEAAVKI